MESLLMILKQSDTTICLHLVRINKSTAMMTNYSFCRVVVLKYTDAMRLYRGLEVDAYEDSRPMAYQLLI